jgi:hypothetical protein
MPETNFGVPRGKYWAELPVELSASVKIAD